MQIKFNNTTYDLKDAINVNATWLQATLIKGENTVESIVSAVEAADVIKVYDGETLIGQYEGYDKPIAFSLYTTDDTEVVSVELSNTDFAATLNTLQSTVNTHDEEIASIDAGISGLADEITVIDNDIAAINESQLSQDAAIEDLAEIVAEANL